ncbi:MAG: RecX family transcriptional regulator [Candidatus Saccharimonadales bacterium]
MKITSISPQVRDVNRVNVLVDGKYRFSLDIAQVGELAIKVGRDYSEEEIKRLEAESEFGKLYIRTLNYCMIRLRSLREVRDYLKKKTMPSRGKTGELRMGASVELAERVLERLQNKGYVDDKKFAEFWVENRSMIAGASQRKLMFELRKKGVNSQIIDETLSDTSRNDKEEIQKIINKKRLRYPDNQKLMAYLARLGFSYDDIKDALSDS